MLTGIVFHGIGIGVAPFNSGKNGIDALESNCLNSIEQIPGMQDFFSYARSR